MAILHSLRIVNMPMQRHMCVINAVIALLRASDLQTKMVRNLVK